MFRTFEINELNFFHKLKKKIPRRVNFTLKDPKPLSIKLKVTETLFPRVHTVPNYEYIELRFKKFSAPVSQKLDKEKIKLPFRTTIT